MAFDKKYYREIKKFVTANIKFDGTRINVHLDMVEGLLEDEDYEAAQAIYDAIEEFISTHIVKDEIIGKDYVHPVYSSLVIPFL